MQFQNEVPTSTPRKEGGSHLHVSDPTHHRGKAKIVDSFTGISDQLKSQQQKEVRKRTCKTLRLKHSHSLAPAHNPLQET